VAIQSLNLIAFKKRLKLRAKRHSKWISQINFSRLSNDENIKLAGSSAAMSTTLIHSPVVLSKDDELLNAARQLIDYLQNCHQDCPVDLFDGILPGLWWCFVKFSAERFSVDWSLTAE
jgi:hypothetical protein